LACGYVDRAELTAEKFIVNPFDPARSRRLYRTGDRARYRADGNIEFIGRTDHQIKLRGFRIELEEIQASLKSHPAVREAVVIVREESGDTRLAAYVTLRSSPATTTELREFLRGRLPEYMRPSSIVLLDAWPLTPSGKLDRLALAGLHPIAPDTGGEAVEARDDCERRLVEIWERLLKVSPVGVRDNYFDLGGHSLLAVRVFSDINKEFGLSLPLSTLFRAPTIEQLAQILRENARSTSGIPRKVDSSRPPLRVGFVDAVRRSLGRKVRNLRQDEPIDKMERPSPSRE
jgi:hypothetical protein